MASVIGAQLYTLRESLKTRADIKATLKEVAALGYEAVQVSGVGPIDPPELKTICDGEGLKIVATHVAYSWWVPALSAITAVITIPIVEALERSGLPKIEGAIW